MVEVAKEPLIVLVSLIFFLRIIGLWLLFSFVVLFAGMCRKGPARLFSHLLISLPLRKKEESHVYILKWKKENLHREQGCTFKSLRAERTKMSIIYMKC